MFNYILYLAGCLVAYTIGKKFYQEKASDLQWTNASMVGMALTALASWLTVGYVLLARYAEGTVIQTWFDKPSKW